MAKLVFAFITVSILAFFLYKPKIGLKLTILNNNLCSRIFRIKHLKCIKFWRFIGLDEKNDILPDGEKRFRIFILIFICLWILILFLIPNAEQDGIENKQIKLKDLFDIGRAAFDPAIEQKYIDEIKNDPKLSDREKEEMIKNFKEMLEPTRKSFKHTDNGTLDLEGTIINLEGEREKAKILSAKAEIKMLDPALALYELDTGKYPERLDGLVKNPGINKWSGPYLKTPPIDPWGKDYNYIYPGTHNQNGYDLSSNGPDGIKGTKDDITNWN